MFSLSTKFQHLNDKYSKEAYKLRHTLQKLMQTQHRQHAKTGRGISHVMSKLHLTNDHLEFGIVNNKTEW